MIFYFRNIVKTELPEVEEQNNKLMSNTNQQKQEIDQLDDRILSILITPNVNILDEEDLVELIGECNESSNVVLGRLTDGEKQETIVHTKREKFRILAKHGATILSVVFCLADIDPMYQFSLAYLTKVFCSVINERKDDTNPNDFDEKRVKFLLDAQASIIYSTVSRGLFEKHRLIFSFLLAVSIEKLRGNLSDDELKFLLETPTCLKEKDLEKPNDVTTKQWNSLVYLQRNFENFVNLLPDIGKKMELKLQDFTVQLFENAENSVQNWDEILSPFNKLQIITILKPDIKIKAVKSFIKCVVGPYFVDNYEIKDLSLVYNDMSSKMPLTFILSPGIDPFFDLQKLAKQQKFHNKLKAVSMGHGQGPSALGAIEEAIKHGHWVFIENSHLAPNWMFEIDSILRNILNESSQVHPNFRLFFSSESTTKFPVEILQNTIKYVCEPPDCIKENLLMSLKELDVDNFEVHVLGKEWQKILFGICFLHNVIIERKKTISTGFNNPYHVRFFI